MGSTATGPELAASHDDEEAAPLVSAAGDGRRGVGTASQTRDLHLLSLAFFFIFLAYHAAQNLQSTVNTDGNLGSISLGLLYTSFTAFSVVGSPVVRGMGSRRALVLGTSGYLLFIAANLAPSWWFCLRGVGRLPRLLDGVGLVNCCSCFGLVSLLSFDDAGAAGRAKPANAKPIKILQ